MTPEEFMAAKIRELGSDLTDRALDAKAYYRDEMDQKILDAIAYMGQTFKENELPQWFEERGWDYRKLRQFISSSKPGTNPTAIAVSAFLLGVVMTERRVSSNGDTVGPPETHDT